jgi:hypothetical protein
MLSLPDGKKNYFQTGPAGKTNDRGEFRIFGLPAGRYYIGIGTQTGTANPSQSQAASVAFQFYPGVVDANQAVPVDISEGSETHIEMKALPPLAGYRIRGSIIDASTGKAPAGRVQIKIISKMTYGQGGAVNSPNYYNSSLGTYEIPDIPPGDYVIQAQAQFMDQMAQAAGEAAWAAFPTARSRVTVVNKDVEKVALTLERPGTIAGRIRTADSTSLDRASVVLEPVVRDEEWFPPRAMVKTDGTFTLFGVLKEYWVQAVAARSYASSVRYDGAEFSDNPLRYPASDTATLDIVLSSQIARVSGRVTNLLFEPVRGAIVVLMPDQRNRPDRYAPQTTTDANGRFSFANVIPGNYKLFAWESIDPLTYMDPAFLREYEQQGKAVRLEQNANATEDLRLIPNR